MSISIIVSTALAFSFIIYLYAGYYWSKRTKNLGDLFPLVMGREAQVKNFREFSASTLASTVSLATLIVAYFELAPYFGFWWLLWTVFTTSAGILIVRIFAKKIWAKILPYTYRPTLHSFLGNEYGSDKLALIAAICTCLGFLGVLATELTVGSRFLAGLMKDIPQWVSVVTLSVVAFIYTAAGGFRVVVVTDRIQMWSVWLLIFVLTTFYFYFFNITGHFEINYSQMPENILNIKWRVGLPAFLFGIFLINTPYYIADMSIWQRIAASQKSDTVFRGLWWSVATSAITWTLLLLLAVFVFAIIVPIPPVNPLITLLNYIGNSFGVIGGLILFLSILGLFGAMLSTASTHLIAVSHALYEDILSRFRSGSIKERVDSKGELRYSRLLLVISAVGSVFIVEILSYLGFSIADLVFSIYGAQLSLTPLVIGALFVKSERLKQVSNWAIAGVTLGFISGWGAAIFGKIIGNADLVFLSPGFSIFVSGLLLIIGFTTTNRNSNFLQNV